jgi:hypothetical protein
MSVPQPLSRLTIMFALTSEKEPLSQFLPEPMNKLNRFCYGLAQLAL